MTTSTQHRRTGAHRTHGLRAAAGVGGTAGSGGLLAASRRRTTARRDLSPGARAALAAYLPGTILKAGSRELADAEIWTLVLAGQPDAPRLVRSGGR